MGKKHGEQFSENRFTFGQESESVISGELSNYFDARNVVSVEPDKAYDNFAEEKRIHQLVDYSGIDYLIDPFDSPVFGVNHRTHSPSKYTLRFDIRKDTGTSSPSELDKLLHSDTFDIVPKYASRMKESESGYEWFRVIELHPFVELLKNDEIGPDKTWDDGDVTAWMFSYDVLESYDIVSTVG